MKLFYTKQGFVLPPIRIAHTLNRVKELRRAGFRKGFALKLVASEVGITVDTAREIWNARNRWMVK